MHWLVRKKDGKRLKEEVIAVTLVVIEVKLLLWEKICYLVEKMDHA